MKTTSFLIARKTMHGWIVKEVTETTYKVMNRPYVRKKMKDNGYKLQSHYKGTGGYFEEMVCVK